MHELSRTTGSSEPQSTEPPSVRTSQQMGYLSIRLSVRPTTRRGRHSNGPSCPGLRLLLSLVVIFCSILTFACFEHFPSSLHCGKVQQGRGVGSHILFKGAPIWPTAPLMPVLLLWFVLSSTAWRLCSFPLFGPSRFFYFSIKYTNSCCFIILCNDNLMCFVIMGNKDNPPNTAVVKNDLFVWDLLGGGGVFATANVSVFSFPTLGALCRPPHSGEVLLSWLKRGCCAPV